RKAPPPCGGPAQKELAMWIALTLMASISAAPPDAPPTDGVIPAGLAGHFSAPPFPAPPPPPELPNGVLFQPSFEVDHELRQPPKAYTPKVGDIYLASEGGWFIRFGHRMAQTGAPNHSGIVIQMPDGKLAMLEGGPGGKPYIGIVDLVPQIT